MNVTLIGAGVMGEAILHSALERGVLNAGDVLVCEKMPDRRALVGRRHNVGTTDDTAAALREGDVVILAVKPQDIAGLAGSVRNEALVLSIMAGVRIETIAHLVGTERIVRVMPNTPAATQQGMSAWTATPAVTAEQRDFAGRLLGALGDELYVESEEKLDMATAVSGSGPAYVFLLIEAMIDGAVTVGLTRAQAEQLALQTFAGAATYARNSGKNVAELRAMVTSPAGTTAAGTLVLEQRAVRAAMIDCVRAAFERARELAQESAQ
jgi:pyrroline-5-carboxylate reductase